MSREPSFFSGLGWGCGLIIAFLFGVFACCGGIAFLVSVTPKNAGGPRREVVSREAADATSPRATGRAVAAPTPQPSRAKATAAEEPPAARFTMSQYGRIQGGMTYDQVKEIMGHHGEEHVASALAGHTSSIVTWQNSDGSNATVTFSDGHVAGRAQFGLR